MTLNNTLQVVTQDPNTMGRYDDVEYDALLAIFLNSFGSDDLLQPKLRERLRKLEELRKLDKPVVGVQCLDIRNHKMYVWTGVWWMEIGFP